MRWNEEQYEELEETKRLLKATENQLERVKERKSQYYRYIRGFDGDVAILFNTIVEKTIKTFPAEWDIKLYAKEYTNICENNQDFLQLAEELLKEIMRVQIPFGKQRNGYYNLIDSWEIEDEETVRIKPTKRLRETVNDYLDGKLEESVKEEIENYKKSIEGYEEYLSRFEKPTNPIADFFNNLNKKHND